MLGVAAAPASAHFSSGAVSRRPRAMTPLAAAWHAAACPSQSAGASARSLAATTPVRCRGKLQPAAAQPLRSTLRPRSPYATGPVSLTQNIIETQSKHHGRFRPDCLWLHCRRERSAQLVRTQVQSRLHQPDRSGIPDTDPGTKDWPTSGLIWPKLT